VSNQQEFERIFLH